jgi:predicted nuclease of predicted toxin-antitoxin system
MKFLIDASLPRQTSQILTAAGYQSVDVRDIGMSTAADADIAAYA